MTNSHLLDYLQITIFVAVGFAFALVQLKVAQLVSPHRPSPEKLSVYECGEVIIGEPWIQFHIRYYIFAILFLIFDIEVAFLFPWALIYKELGLFGLVEMFVFILILLLGLIYPWRKGVLKWV